MGQSSVDFSVWPSCALFTRINSSIYHLPYRNLYFTDEIYSHNKINSKIWTKNLCFRMKIQEKWHGRLIKRYPQYVIFKLAILALEPDFTQDDWIAFNNNYYTEFQNSKWVSMFLSYLLEDFFQVFLRRGFFFF